MEASKISKEHSLSSLSVEVRLDITTAKFESLLFPEYH